MFSPTLRAHSVFAMRAPPGGPGRPLGDPRRPLRRLWKAFQQAPNCSLSEEGKFHFQIFLVFFPSFFSRLPEAEGGLDLLEVLKSFLFEGLPGVQESPWKAFQRSTNSFRRKEFPIFQFSHLFSILKLPLDGPARLFGGTPPSGGPGRPSRGPEALPGAPESFPKVFWNAFQR